MLPEEIQNGLVRGEVSEGHCRTLLALDGRLEEQMALYRDIVDKKMSVRLVEKITRNMVNGNTGGRRKRQCGIKINGEKLADTLGTKVQIEMAGGRGTISINFFSNEELNAFINKMMAEVDKKVGIGSRKPPWEALMEL